MTQELLKTPWTPAQLDELDAYVRPLVDAFIVWAKAFGERGTQPLPDFEDCEVYVEGSVEYDGTQPHLTYEQCAQIVTRVPSAAYGLFEWVRDDGLGAWTEMRDERPEVYTPNAMFAEVVASWLHDIIGCPSPEDY